MPAPPTRAHTHRQLSIGSPCPVCGQDVLPHDTGRHARSFAGTLSYGRLPSEHERERLLEHLARASGNHVALDVLARIMDETLAAAEQLVAELETQIADLTDPADAEQLISGLRTVARAWGYLPLRTTPLFR